MAPRAVEPVAGKVRSAPVHLRLGVGLALVAFALRLWRLGDVPPGWRDDELIEALVIAGKVLDGQLALFYPDASGHEALYHVLHAGFMAAFGANALGIRLLSAICGTLTVALTYRLGRRLFGPRVGTVAAAALAASFWSLIYSRIGLRHALLPVLTLAAFDAFWRGLYGRREGAASALTRAAVFTGLGFYVYFAGRGVPLILLAFAGAVWLFDRARWRARWRPLALMAGLIALLALPLAVTLAGQPEAEGRVAELAVPLTALRAGDLGPLWAHVRDTLGMFHATGDPEWLYNIPGRPVFGPIGAIAFWLGVVGSVGVAARGLWRRHGGAPPAAMAALFLLLWWLAAISPGFLSVPAASLGHTILAQPATYLLFALPVAWLARRRRPAAVGLALLLVGVVAARDLPDYFATWPARGLVRFLHHADNRDVARFVAADPALADFAISGPLAGPWSRVALEIDLANATDRPIRPRWYNAERAIFLALGGAPALAFHSERPGDEAFPDRYGPPQGRAGAYRLSPVEGDPSLGSTETCFANGLCADAATYDAATGRLALTWRVAAGPDLPAMPLISNPPPPGVYAGPRLLVFAQLVDAGGAFLAGDDGLWVDPVTLRPGDVFRQWHALALPPDDGAAEVRFGLYDPLTGRRILTVEGQEVVGVALGR